jgi:predicted transcriptional regulator
VEELSGEDGVSLNMVARKLDKSPQATKYLLDKLIREGLVMKIGRGKYKPI